MTAVVFWDEKGVILVEFMELRTTITADVYFETKTCDPKSTIG